MSRITVNKGSGFYDVTPVSDLVVKISLNGESDRYVDMTDLPRMVDLLLETYTQMLDKVRAD